MRGQIPHFRYLLLKQSYYRSERIMLYAICYGNEGASYPACDVDSYVVIIKLLYYIVKIILVCIFWWEIRTHLNKASSP
jgi:hypothetical protein